MVRFIGFAWSNFASVALGLSAFESTGIYLFNGNGVPEYCPPFLIPVKKERAPPNMTVVFVTTTSGTKPQNVFPSSAEHPLITESSTLPFEASPEEITSSRFLKMINRVPKTPRTYSTENIAPLFFYYWKIWHRGKEKKQIGNQIKEQRNLTCKQLQLFWYTRSENAEKEVNENRYS